MLLTNDVHIKDGELSGTSLGAEFRYGYKWCSSFSKNSQIYSEMFDNVRKSLKNVRKSSKIKIFQKENVFWACAKSVFREFPPIPDQLWQQQKIGFRV